MGQAMNSEPTYAHCGNVFKPRRCRHQPEAQLQRSLVEHLRWCARSDVWWAHIPNGGARTAIEGAIFKSLGVQPGAPDLLVVRAGQALFIECKALATLPSASMTVR